MPYRVTCPSCKTIYLIPEDSFGKKLQCKKCRQPFIAGNAKTPLLSEAKPTSTDRVKPANVPPCPEAKAPLRSEAIERRAVPSDPPVQPKKSPRRSIVALAGVLIFFCGAGAGIAVTILFYPPQQEAGPIVQAAAPASVQGVNNSSSIQKGEQAAQTDATAFVPGKDFPKPAPPVDRSTAAILPPPSPAPIAPEPPDPPVADRAELPRAAEVGKPFKYQLAHPTQKVRSYTLHNGPKGLKMSKAGLIQWTPEPGQVGTHRLLVGVVTDKMSGANIYTVRVNDAGTSTAKALPADLDLVPSKETVFLSVQPAELWNNPTLAPIRKWAETNKEIAASLASLKQGTGIDLGDIQRAVLVFWGKQENPNSVVLVTTVKPFGRPQILGLIGEGQREETINGKSVISSPKSRFALHVLNERTFLSGRAAEVKKLLAQPARAARTAQWSDLLHSAPQHALLIGVQRDHFPDDPKKQTPPPLKVLNPLLDAQMASATLDADKDLRLTLRLTFAREEQVKAAEGAARQGLSLASTFLSQFAQQFKKNAPGQLPPPLAKLVSAAQDAEASVKKATIQIQDRALECQVKLQSSDWPEALAAGASLFLAPGPTKPTAAPAAPPPAPRKAETPKKPEQAEATVRPPRLRFRLVRIGQAVGSSRDTEQTALRVHRSVVRMPQGYSQAGAFFEHGHLLRRTRQSIGRLGRQPRLAVEIVYAAAGELARGRIQLADAGRVIARPTQAPRTIRFHTLTVPA